MYMSSTELQGLASYSQGLGGRPGFHVLPLDVLDEQTIVSAATQTSKLGSGQVHALYNVAGVLQDKNMNVAPEKRSADISTEGLVNSFRINSVGPALVAKHFSPLLAAASRELRRSPQKRLADTYEGILPGTPTAVFFSARVGSSEDNRLGGWYSYRASKAALNSLVKTLSVELRKKGVTSVSIHPGTVDTDLTREFLKSNALVQPVDSAAANLVGIVSKLDLGDTGTFLDWTGRNIPY